jgi:replicative DNA helicase
VNEHTVSPKPVPNPEPVPNPKLIPNPELIPNQDIKANKEDFERWIAECKKDKSFYLDWGSDKLNYALKGIKGGMSLLVGGVANFGKSQMLTFMARNLLNANENILVADFTLDDPKNKRITQYVASMAHLDMNTVDFVNRVYEIEKLKRFEEACREFENWINSGKLFIWESSSGLMNAESRSDIRFIVSKTEKLKRDNPSKKIIILLDSLNDLEATVRSDDPYVRSESLTKELNRLIVRTESILIASTHLRKNGGRRPTLEDLKGNNFLSYSAKVVIGIHNDMKLNKDRAKVFWTGKKPNGQEVNLPIMEAHFLKSKVSDFNSIIAFQQWPSQARLKEADNQDMYLDIIYGEM